MVALEVSGEEAGDRLRLLQILGLNSRSPIEGLRIRSKSVLGTEFSESTQLFCAFPADGIIKGGTSVSFRKHKQLRGWSLPWRVIRSYVPSPICSRLRSLKAGRRTG